jgi:hypothetical protein
MNAVWDSPLRASRKGANLLSGILLSAIRLGTCLAAVVASPGPAAAAPAQELPPATEPGSPAGGSEAAPAESASTLPGNYYVAEIVDTTYTVGPAEFFALDLPGNPEGAVANHLSGTITVAGKKGDIIVRVFRTADYKGWLKKRDLKVSNPLWSSKRSKNVALSMDLPPGVPMTLLLDNGYSLRTSKRVHCQLQMQYARTDGAFVAGASGDAGGPSASPAADDLVTPRSNTEEEAPPPPPPPPDEGAP